MEKIDDVLEKLLRDCNCYDEEKIKEKIKRQTGRHLRRNVLYNVGLGSGCFDVDEIDIREAYIIFGKYFNDLSDFETLLSSLNGDDREKFSLP